MNVVATLPESRSLAPAADMLPARVVGASTSMFNDPHKFEHAQRVARVFAESQLVPNHMRGKLPDCLIALNLADRLNEDPLTVMQNIVVVHGSPGWKATYLIARANVSGRLHGPIRWKHEGTPGRAGYTCTAYADLADPRLSQDERRIEAAVTWEMAEAEGWTKNAKYKSMPQVMMQYRAATFLVRLFLSDIMLGIQSTDVELETAQDENGVYQVTGSAPSAPPARLPRRQPEPEPISQTEVIDQTTGEITSSVPKPPARQRGATAKQAEAERIIDAEGTIVKDKNPEALADASVEGQTAEGEGSGVQPSAATSDFPGDQPMNSLPDFEALLAEFERDAPNATTEQELGEIAADLRRAMDDHPPGRDFQTRAGNAWQDQIDRINKLPRPAEQKRTDVDANDPDYKRGWTDAEKGVKRCLKSDIRDNPDRLAKWQAGVDAFLAQKTEG